jgi:signal transduction histidine kinase
VGAQAKCERWTTHRDTGRVVAGSQSKTLPGRAQTDESLRLERENLDRAMSEARVSVEKQADAVVELARATADAVLGAARERADQKLRQTESEGTTRVARESVTEERALADHVVRADRAHADETLKRERAEHERALAALLPLERLDTDRYLVTERARSDDSLSNRDDFLGIVSHDLRNLLGGIAHSAALLADDATGTEQGHQVLAGAHRIQRYVAQMNRLIGDLLDLASVEAGKLSITAAQADLGAVVAEAVEIFRAVGSEKGISLESQVSEQRLMGVFDQERILQVLTNLISNAIKFTPPGGLVRVTASRAGDGLALCVADTGRGIPADMLESIFERFSQVGKNDRRGVGLGLYIAKHIVDEHRGAIWAKSRVGQGSQFFVTLAAA